MNGVPRMSFHVQCMRRLLDGVIFLLIALILAIAMNGSVTLAALNFSLTAHHVRYIGLTLVLALILRKILTGAYFYSDALAHRLNVSPHLLAYWLWMPALLAIAAGAAIWLNPLQKGLIGTYYATPDWSGKPMLTARDAMPNLWRMQTTFPEKEEQFSIEWAGVIMIPATGAYQFATRSDDGSELLIDGQCVVDNRGRHGIQEQSGGIRLEQGAHALRVRYAQETGGADFQAFWTRPRHPRALLARALLLPEEPSRRALLLGQCCFLLARASLFALLVWLILSLLLGVSHRRVLARLMKNGAIARLLKFIGLTNPPTPETGAYRWRVSLAALLGYTLISLAWTYPLIRDFSTNVTGLGGDRYIWLWDIWWMKTALLKLRVSPLFTDYLFYPGGVQLAFHDSMWLNSLFSVPLQSLFSRVELYNLFFLGSYILGGFGMFLLARYLTNAPLAGFVAGLIFAFWGGRTYYCDQLSSASIQWFPFCMFYLAKTLRETPRRFPALAGLFWAMSALSGWYNAVFASLLVGAWLMYAACAECRRFFSWPVISRIALMTLIFAALMFPFLAPMLTDIFTGEDYMKYELIPSDCASVNALLLPGANHGVLGKFVRYGYASIDAPPQWGVTGAAFIGYTTLALCAYAAWRVNRRETAFWLIAALAFIALALGPRPQLFAKTYNRVPLPFALLQYLPALNIIRLPVRFMIPAMLCGGVAAGYGCADLLRRLRFRAAAFALISAAILFEFYRPLYITPLEETPAFYAELGRDADDYAILELTRLGIWEHSSARSSLFQTTHQKRLFHGHISRVPLADYHQAYLLYTVFDDLLTQPEEAFAQAEFSLEAHQRTILPLLAHYRVRYVTLYYDYAHGGFAENARRLERLFGGIAAEGAGMRLFRVEAAPPASNQLFPGFGMGPLRFDAHTPPTRTAANLGEFKLLNVNGRAQAVIAFEIKHARQEATPIDVLMNNQPIATVSAADWTAVRLSAPLRAGENTLKLRLAGNADTNVSQVDEDLYLRGVTMR